MGMMIKNMLWGLLAVLLFMPLIQYNLNIFTLTGLRGNYEQSPDATFSKRGWWEGTYQETKTKYFNDHVGFRPDLVRISNQVDFSLFNIARGATMGREHYLFYDEYVWATVGSDFLGMEFIRDQVQKMKYIQDALEKEGRSFLFAEAASKTDFLPEMVYSIRDTGAIGQTNHKAYTYYCDSLGVAHFDIGAFLKPLKGNIKQRLFTKQGIHWSLYGAMYVVDSLIKYIEDVRNVDLANPKWSTYVTTDQPRKTDNDIGETLNLIFPIKETFYYPEIKFPEDTVENKPSAIYIGDSFTWTLIYDSLMNHTHSSWEFWYYFNTVHTQKTMNEEEQTVSIPDHNWKEKLDAADCVILVFVPQNFPEMSRFIDSAYNHYKSKEDKRVETGKAIAGSGK